MARRLVALLAAAAIVGVPTLSRAAEDDARAVVEKAIRAHGGQETLAKLKAGETKSKGSIKLPGAGEVQFTEESAHMLPDKLKETLHMEIGGKPVVVVTLCKGDDVSIEVNDKAIEVTDAIKQSIRDAMHVIRVSRLTPLLQKKEFQLSIVGEDKVEGKPAMGVRVSSKGHKDVNLYFDKKTNMLVKMEHRTVDASSGNEIREEHLLMDYKKDEKSGISQPHKVRINHDGEKFMEIEVEEAKELEELPDSTFTK